MSTIDLTTNSTSTQTQVESQINYSLCKDNINLSKLDANGWLIDNGNKNKENIIAIKDHSNKVIAVVNAYQATEAQVLAEISQEKRENCWFIDSIWVSPDHPVSEAAPLALYFGIKSARIYDKDIVITAKNKQDNFPVMTMINGREIQELTNGKLLIGQKIEYSLLGLANQLPCDSNEFITTEFINDMYKMFFTWYDKFNKGSWCQAINNKTITKNQYISTLYNLHAYVKYTTRICARAVAHSDDPFLRNNYIDHFKGEINHEILIQKDLIKMGEDVDYLKNYYIPNTKTKSFMILQESTIGFYQDPILLLACPFVAEGISANFKDELLENLEETIGEWGVEKPDQAMRFFNSHVKFDGGEDGHWEDVIKILPLYVKTEHERQRFISIVKFGMDALYDSFNSNVDENLIW